KINEKLEKSVKRKTKALKELNENLEKRLEKELIISRKKDQTIFLQSKNASLGEMLENVSHQWRQPLGAISMIIQSFETKLEKNKLTPEFVKSQVNEAMILANGMSQTLEDFRSFYSPTKAKKTFTLNEVINDAIRLTKYLLQKKEIELIFDKSQEITIYSFKNELLQVLINIINNAKDAINEKEDVKLIWIKLTKLDGFARIEIMDNGGGIDAIIIDKIFEPYFTTKHKSLGTGIGLYMSKNIVEKHLKGNLYVKNVILGRNEKEYKCANFIIDLPLKDES
ncbi:sensor histidine kinase, partial [Campylobacter ureolyticus]|uniref:sensor histidine kinase n=1 Tax=Campylobacter ureolyticus TaxID=827 RepID=UPI002912A5E1